MSFIEEYKHLEKLCGEILNDSKGISAYIDEMTHTNYGSYYVKNWENDLKQLKHYRWIRNQIAHEPNCTEANMCNPEDEKWLENFYSLIMEQNDPLTLYSKATQNRHTSNIKPIQKIETPQPVIYSPTLQPKRQISTHTNFPALLLFIILIFILTILILRKLCIG